MVIAFFTLKKRFQTLCITPLHIVESHPFYWITFTCQLLPEHYNPSLTLYENHICTSALKTQKKKKKKAKALIWPSSSPDSSLIDMQGLQQTAQPPEDNNALLCFLQQWLCLNSTCLLRKILFFLVPKLNLEKANNKCKKNSKRSSFGFKRCHFKVKPCRF